MRLFIAINFEDEVKGSLSRTIAELKQQSVEGRFPKEEHMHLTLVFLGEVTPERMDEVKAVMDGIDRIPISLEIAGFGKFVRRGEVLYWCGVKENPQLYRMQGILAAGLREKGLPADDKPFSPHITLGRKCVMKEGFSEEEFQKKMPAMHMPVRAISLMKSEQAGGNLKHTEIYRVELENRDE